LGPTRNVPGNVRGFVRPTFALQPRAIMARWPVGCKRLLGGESGRNIGGMTKAAEAVLADALRLDVDSRAELAAELLASLDGPADPDAEAAWKVEIERRVAAIEAGRARLEPWEDVKRRIERDILGR
jgi:putative addiction module component (TIGR02574 family)